MVDENKAGPRILVLGFGALGALYGFLLARGGAQVYAVARSNAVSLRERGIDICSEKYGNHQGFKPAGVFRSAEQVREEATQRPFDYILCTIKICPEQRLTGKWIREYLPSGKGRKREDLTTIVFVENGIGIEEEPYEELCQGEDAVAGTIISCCAWLGATLTEGGKKVQHSALETLEMGLYPYREEGEQVHSAATWREAKLQTFADTYLRGDGGAKVIEGDIQVRRWNKLLWNAAWGGMATLARKPVSVILGEESLASTSEAVRKIMLEVLAVARACGYGEDQFPSKNVDNVFHLTYSQAPSLLKPGQPANLKDDFKPSLLVDLEANRPFELSPIIGNVISKAHAHKVDVPRLETIYAALHPSLMQAIKASM